MVLALMALTVPAQAAGPGGGWTSTAVGIRLGWSGAPNGLTIRQEVGPGQAFEFVAGYNGKVGRTQNLPFAQRGNSFIGASYAPYLRLAGISLNADFGARARLHHYRSWRSDGGGAKITPDLIAGGGIQVELGRSVQLFADLHLVYYNRYDNVYAPATESGLGIRFLI